MGFMDSLANSWGSLTGGDSNQGDGTGLMDYFGSMDISGGANSFIGSGENNRVSMETLMQGGAAGLGYMAQQDANKTNQSYDDRMFAQQQNLTDLQIENRDYNRAKVDEVNASLAEGFNQAFGYPTKKKKPTTPLGAPASLGNAVV